MMIEVFFTVLAVQKNHGSNIITAILIKANPPKCVISHEILPCLVLRKAVRKDRKLEELLKTKFSLISEYFLLKV